MKVLCDCDGVILDFSLYFIEHWNLRGYKPTIKYPPKDWNFGLKDPKPIPKRLDEFYRSTAVGNLPLLFDDAPAILNSMATVFDVTILTNVPKFIKQKRIENLAKHKITFSNTLDLVTTDNKTEYLKKLRPTKKDPIIVIDDRPDTISIASMAGFKVFYPNCHIYTQGLEKYGVAFENFTDLKSKIKQFISSIPTDI
jgi:hypothetical protein